MLCGIFLVLNLIVLFLIKRKLNSVRYPQAERRNLLTIKLYYFMLANSLVELIDVIYMITWIAIHYKDETEEIFTDKNKAVRFWFPISQIIFEKAS